MRNPWVIALWVVTAAGLAACLVGGYALVEALPRQRTMEDYAGIDWTWVNIIQALWLPAAAIAFLCGGIGLLIVYGVSFRTRT